MLVDSVESMMMHGLQTLKLLGYPYGRRLGSEIAWANRKEGDAVGVGPVAEQSFVNCHLHLF